LADSYATQGALSYAAPADTFPAAERHAVMALALNNSLSEPHASLGFAKLYYDWDWATAEARFRRATALGPATAAGHQWLAVFLVAAGRFDEAYDAIECARSAEPLSLPINTDLGFIHYYTRRCEEALKQLDAVLEMNPEFQAAHLWRGRALQELGRYDAAIGSFRQVDAQLRGWPVSIAARGHAQAVAGQDRAARQTLAELRQLASRKFVTSYGVALVYAGLGEADTAFAWLDRAFDERSNWLVWLRLDPRWGALRADSRFARLVARLHYPSGQVVTAT
jgi:tetratricopeptide (TPR) repeat protein